MLIVYTILIACCAIAYSNILTSNGQLLNGIYNYLERKLPGYLFKPLIGCHKCVSGQWALWLYLFYFKVEYDIIIHIWFILQTIFNATVINLFYEKMNPNIRKTKLPPEILSYGIKKD